MQNSPTLACAIKWKKVEKSGKISKDNNPYVVQSVLLPKAARIGQKLCGSVDFALDILRTIPNGDKYIKTDDNVAAARNTSIGKC